MSDDFPDSLGDEPTYVGKGKEREEQSQGDQSTYAGSNESSLGDLGGIGDDLGDSLAGLEIVDLESRYTIIRPIGKGGMGEVFLATDTRLNRKVAIKRIKDELTTPAAAARFLTEAKSIAALSHPYIVQVYDYGRAKDGPFLIMEYVEGENLQQVCNQGVMALEDAIDLACKLCDALAKAHSLGIIHRDIKPANILMTEEGWPKISDFGLAKSTSDHGHTMTGTALGTLDFMPSEQRRDASAVDHRSDLWSLAATIYQMVTGEPPKVIDLEEVPPVLRTVLGKALKTQPDKRYQNVKSFRDDIEQCISSAALPIGQLNIGECPSCNTRNESTRKFCRVCAASLVTDCLKCGESIAVWDKICGECGVKQREASEEFERELINQIKRARNLIEKSQCESALDVAKGVLIKAEGRFESAENWAKEFIEVNSRYFESLVDGATSAFLIAKKHREKFEYPESLQVLRTINSEVRTSEMNSFERAVKLDFKELNGLLAEVDRLAKDPKFTDNDELISKIARAVELGGLECAQQKGLISLKEDLNLHRSRMVKDYAIKKVRLPSIALIILNSIGILLHLIALINIANQGSPTLSSSLMALGFSSYHCVVGFAVTWGCVSMLSLHSYRFAYISCFLCCIPIGTPSLFLSVPFGIWGVMVLEQQRVKAAFAKRKPECDDTIVVSDYIPFYERSRLGYFVVFILPLLYLFYEFVSCLI